MKAETSIFGLFDIQIVLDSITKNLGAITVCNGSDLDLIDGVINTIKKYGGNQIEQQCKSWL